MALFVRRRWPRWVAAAAVLAALVASGVGLAVRDDAPSPDRVLETAEPLPADTGPPPTPIADVLAASDARLRAYDGTPVGATSLPVLTYVSGSAVWVGTSSEQRVLAVLVTADKAFTVKAGDRLTFTGTVRRVAPAFAKALGLAAADEAELIRQGAYVEVTDFTAG
jgi:hypothetical protein